MSLAGKSVLVLGGNGYLGNHFAARLVQQQAKVYALSRQLFCNVDQASNINTQKTHPLIGSKDPSLNPIISKNK